jgi:hypothetical protein
MIEIARYQGRQINGHAQTVVLGCTRTKGDVARHRECFGGMLMIMGYTRMRGFLRRSTGVDIDKSDMDQLTDLIGKKLNNLLVIGVCNASYNNRIDATWPYRLVRAEVDLDAGVLRFDAWRRREATVQFVLRTIAYQLPPRRFGYDREALTLAQLSSQECSAGYDTWPLKSYRHWNQCTCHRTVC